MFKIQSNYLDPYTVLLSMQNAIFQVIFHQTSESKKYSAKRPIEFEAITTSYLNTDKSTHFDFRYDHTSAKLRC